MAHTYAAATLSRTPLTEVWEAVTVVVVNEDAGLAVLPAACVLPQSETPCMHMYTGHARTHDGEARPGGGQQEPGRWWRRQETSCTLRMLAFRGLHCACTVNLKGPHGPATPVVALPLEKGKEGAVALSGPWEEEVSPRPSRLAPPALRPAPPPGPLGQPGTGRYSRWWVSGCWW